MPLNTALIMDVYGIFMKLFLCRLVTPYSKIQMRLLHHSLFRRDTLIGEADLDLYPLLQCKDGKLSLLQKCFNLEGSSISRNCRTTLGSLFVVLDGINIDMSLVPEPPRYSQNSNNGKYF